MTLAKPEVRPVAECTYDDSPLCAKNPPFNATLRAAIAEGDAIFSGERPAKWYRSMEEARQDAGV